MEVLGWLTFVLGKHPSAVEGGMEFMAGVALEQWPSGDVEGKTTLRPRSWVSYVRIWD